MVHMYLFLFASIGHFIVLSTEFINFSRFSLSTMLVFHVMKQLSKYQYRLFIMYSIFSLSKHAVMVGYNIASSRYPMVKVRILIFSSCSILLFLCIFGRPQRLLSKASFTSSHTEATKCNKLRCKLVLISRKQIISRSRTVYDKLQISLYIQRTTAFSALTTMY